MKNTQQTLQEIKERYASARRNRNFWQEQQKEAEESHQWKKASQYEMVVAEFFAQGNTLVSMYAFIKEIDYVDAIKELIDYAVEEDLK